MSGIPTLERYLARQIYGAVGFVLLGFLALFAFFDLIAELRDLGNGNYQLRQIFSVVALWVPGHAYELFPVAVLIGTLYVLAHLSSNSEYTVMRAAGLSPLRAGGVLAKVGLAFVVATFAIGEWIAPFTEELAQKVRMQAMQSLIGGDLSSGLWFKDERSFINVREAREAHSLGGVRIYEFDAAYRLRQVTAAERGEYAGEGKWRLVEVSQTLFGPGGPTVARSPEAEWRSAVSPDLLNVLIVAPERMSAWKLYKYLQHLAGNRQKTERYEIALWKKLFYPLATLVMMALALPFAYIDARSGMVGIKVFLGIMLGIFFHMLNSLFSHVGLLKEWPPVAAAAVPSLLFFATAILMMLWIERLRPYWVRIRG
ncbi:MAG: LPS export ABC transporter permease LptG [Betaproteobacteria bacterium RBG_16_66_20]|nr:MAG: LPS export ABC transporter permease LptG [Betaproteobacteria bacterium RBG_16_66_20]